MGQPIAGRDRRLRPRLWPAVLVLCAALFADRCALSQETDLRLRIAWGGGESRRWEALVSVSQGVFSEPAALGLDPDVPGSIDLSGGEVRITQRIARTYDGVDLLVTAPLDAILTVVLTPLDGQGEPYRTAITLAQLLNEYYTAPVDKRNNSIVVRRAPGDRLRLRFERDHLVFSPGERFTLQVVPHLAALAAGASFTCRLQLLRGGTSDEVWSAQKDVRTADDGRAPPIGPFEIEIPPQEGVYDVMVSLIPSKRFAPPFGHAKPVLQRKLQLVVIDPTRPDPPSADWQVELEINPANPGWWDRIKRLPQLKLIPGFGRGPLGNGRASPAMHHGQKVIQLAAGGWQAYPLPLERPGLPHLLEVEFPGDVGQTLGISIVEPNAAGAVVPIGLDSGVQVAPPVAGSQAQPGTLRHRLVFWPRTTSPLLLLTNQRDSGVAVFGLLRVLSGPPALPAAPGASPPADGRLVAAYFDRPLFPENFGAGEALDEWSHQTRDDWRTFYLGGRRLTDYLRFAGYNGAVLSVLSEGSTIYPSQLLQPTAKYDSGTFFITGQDPVRKDVLEMLLRLFDRKGLRLIAALRFSSPLPALERILRRGGVEAVVGIELVSDRGATGLSENGTRRGEAPYYNPLDPRVQQAMVDVVAEITERYGHHPSFAGLALQLGPTSYAQLPGDWWGYDDRTISRFEEETGVDVPGRGPGRFAARADFLQNKVRHQWLTWRAKTLAKLYEAMLSKIEQKRSDGKLYLAAAQSLSSPQMHSALYPKLPARTTRDLSEALLQIGIAPDLYKDQPNLVLLRPQRQAVGSSPAARAIDQHLNRSPQLDRIFAGLPHPGSFCYHAPRPRPLPSFDRQSPFGPERTQTWLAPHISPAGDENRRRFVHLLATLDIQSVFDGGWMALLGQEDSLREIFEVYRRLPAVRFRSAVPRDAAAAAQGVVVRTLSRADQSYVYLANDAAWPATVDLELEAPAGCRLQSLSSRQLMPLERLGSTARWRVQLQPYDLVGATFSSPSVEVTDWRVTGREELVAELRRQVAEVEARFNALPNLRPLDVLENPGFELPSEADAIPGWDHIRGVGVSVAADQTQPHEGQRALRLSVRGEEAVAWVRSQPFEAPQSGRVTVFVWLRIEDADRQPPLRLAIEGRFNGQVYYKFAPVGLGEAARPLSTRWVQFIFRVDDLPPEGLTDLRVGFDLMGPGTVWIDDVQVFDRWFDPDNELDELLKSIALAKFQLDQGKVAPCQRFLESYWARFLLRYVPPPPRLAEVPRREPVSPEKPAPPPEPKKPSMLERLKGWLPKQLLPF